MPGSDPDLSYLSATELGRMIRAKQISPREVVDNALARIEEVNPKLNAFCFVYAEEARAKAKAAEAAVLAGDTLGPLHGVPIAIKDFTPTKGKRTTLGSKIFEHWIPDEDPPIVERLLGAGAILIGKTTTPELAHSSFTHSPLWGVTRNPWRPERTSGGSSGGSAVAVATGCVPLAEGTDAGGSVRIPAALSGCVGLKPSFGRIPLAILPTAFEFVLHFGPLARTLADAALFLDVAQGPDDRDLLSLPGRVAIPDPLPSDLRGLRLALSCDLGFFALDPDVERNTREAALALREAGATVEEVKLPWKRDIVEALFGRLAVLFAACFAGYLKEWRGAMTPALVTLIEDGVAMSAVDYKRLEFVQTSQWETLRRLFERFDALLCPTMALPAPDALGNDFQFFEDDAQGRFKGLDMTSPFNNVSPCPVLSVPSGFTREGLPTALQIVGHRYDEVAALRIGAALERRRPWAQHRPPI